MTRRRRLYAPIETDLPCDFPQRLERLKEASGLSWRELARRLGTEPKTLRRWRRGVSPGSTYILRLLILASSVPGAVAALLEHVLVPREHGSPNHSIQSSCVPPNRACPQSADRHT